MDAKIVSIGNSKGVRIPKALFRQAELDPSRPVKLKVLKRAIVIEQGAAPRAGWAEALRAARAKRVKEDLWGRLPLNEALDPW